MNDATPLEIAVESAAGFLSGNDLEFFRRVWQTDMNRYRHRLQGLLFSGLGNVLDAGSGMGQWTRCLAESNESVVAFDFALERLQATQAILSCLGVSNYDLAQGSVECLPFAAASFDAVFCYSVLPVTAYQRTLSEFSRVLRPGGRVYICTNGFGHYLSLIVENRNRSEHYNPRVEALQSIFNTLRYQITGHYDADPMKCLMISSRHIEKALGRLGFGDILVHAEGTTNLGNDPDLSLQPFFRGRYWGFECVYEVVATKA